MIMTMRKEVIPYHMLFLPIKLIENLEFRWWVWQVLILPPLLLCSLNINTNMLWEREGERRRKR
jgi:hypothetical protein